MRLSQRVLPVLLLAAACVSCSHPSVNVAGHSFNGTEFGDGGREGGVVTSVSAEDPRAEPTSAFLNEVAGDAAAALLGKPATPTVTPAPTPTPLHTTPWVSSSSGSSSSVSDSDNETIAFEDIQQKQHVQYAIRSGAVQSQGVNLGGWLVSEHWMNQASDIWKGLTETESNSGEQTAFKNTPHEDALARFKWHRDNFITEKEIEAIAKAGINTVRVPVGYWIVGFDNHDISGMNQWQNYAPGGLAYLDRLVRDWAKKYNVAVMISMHGAKGSQNGADHSSPEQKEKSYWSHYAENMASTLDAVVYLADRYHHDAAFLGIGLLNEPGGSTSNSELYKYYEDAYKAIREDAKNDCVLTIAPLLWEQSANHMTELLPGASNVWVEWHRYFVWGYEDKSEDELMGSAITQFRDDVNAWKQKSDKKMFIGELSFATAGKFQDHEKLKQFGAKQMDVLLNTVDGGWAFWSWRIYGDENGVNPWSLRSLLRNGLFPHLRATTKS